MKLEGRWLLGAFAGPCNIRFRDGHGCYTWGRGSEHVSWEHTGTKNSAWYHQCLYHYPSRLTAPTQRKGGSPCIWLRMLCPGIRHRTIEWPGFTCNKIATFYEAFTVCLSLYVPFSYVFTTSPTCCPTPGSARPRERPRGCRHE